jgi:hypothetical protein
VNRESSGWGIRGKVCLLFQNGHDLLLDGIAEFACLARWNLFLLNPKTTTEEVAHQLFEHFHELAQRDHAIVPSGGATQDRLLKREPPTANTQSPVGRFF